MVLCFPNPKKTDKTRQEEKETKDFVFPSLTSSLLPAAAELCDALAKCIPLQQQPCCAHSCVQETKASFAISALGWDGGDGGQACFVTLGRSLPP